MKCAQAIFQKTLQLIAWKKLALNGSVYDFYVDYNTISDIVDIHKHLMKNMI